MTFLTSLPTIPPPCSIREEYEVFHVLFQTFRSIQIGELTVILASVFFLITHEPLRPVDAVSEYLGSVRFS